MFNEARDANIAIADAEGGAEKAAADKSVDELADGIEKLDTKDSPAAEGDK